MRIPSSTYRVQLHKDFGLDKLEAIIDYLSELGITTIYASPITTAMPGSLHGYDVIDPHSINPEIGTIEQLKRISGKLKAKKMSWIQDIVPNHMAFSTYNLRLMDVLERGPSSEFFHYFDINWNHPDPQLRGKLMVPILESSIDDCIEKDKIKLSYSDETGFTIDYEGNQFPLSACAYNFLTETCKVKNPAFLTELVMARQHSWRNSNYNEWTETKAACLSGFDENHELLGECLDLINDDKSLLKQLLDKQYFTLAGWQETNEKINYRRFFTVNNLICLSMEYEETFYDYHSFLLQLYKDGLIQGLRIDHIDGLNDPGEYLRRLRKLFGDDCYIVAEKILETNESLPSNWKLQGTSGYEFLSRVSQVLTDKSGGARMKKLYAEVLKEPCQYNDIVFNKKRLILLEYMQGELSNLVNFFLELGLNTSNLPVNRLKDAIALFMICLPVYRLYPENFPLSKEELKMVDTTINKALLHDNSLANELHQLRNIFEEKASENSRSQYKILFLKRLMQFTGPLTAKGVEDTSFYIYNPLISHCEVGDTPSFLGADIEEFHEQMRKRLQHNPTSMNCTATHDTKRGEDARMRINILSELPEEWNSNLQEWMKINHRFIKMLPGGESPTVNDQYFLYQSLLGGFPGNYQADDQYVERLSNYFIKVIREAKVRTNWNQPDADYENACISFIQSILDAKHSFLKTFIPFVKKINEYASLYSLNQALIKITAPGIPDIYQGCELWDLSYVDPDNRRPVDYTIRQELLAGLLTKDPELDKEILPEASRHRLDYLAQHREQGLEKLYVTYHALHARKSNPDLFIKGEYIPIDATEPKSVLAFARAYQKNWLITIAPLNTVKYNLDWSKIELILPHDAPGSFMNLLTGTRVEAKNGRIRLENFVGLLKNI